MMNGFLWRTGVIYMDGNGVVFYSPEGVTQVFFDSLAMARAELGSEFILVKLSRPIGR